MNTTTQTTTAERLRAAIAERAELDEHISDLFQQTQAARARHKVVVATIIDLERGLFTGNQLK